jgi:hypothetical protein
MPENYLYDLCFWIYVAIVVVALYGFLLFVWWWKKVGHASEVYICFTILLASEAFYNFWNALARYLRFNDLDLSDYMGLMDHPIWRYRAVFHLVILTVIVVRMTMRAVSTIQKAKRFTLEDSDVQNTNR